MKEHRVKPSKAAVTTIDVSGRQHHYTHSKKLGKIRAILIDEDENQAIPYQLTAHAKVALAESKRLKLEQDSQHKLVQEQAAQAPKTLSKGDKLKILMDAADRLHKRYWAFYKLYSACEENDHKGRANAFAKMERVHKASNRILQKIKALLL
jgi:hypothetical protein